MALVVEPKKPRLAWDGRLVNLFRDAGSVRFDTLRDFQRGIQKGDRLFSLDHKSGYHHVVFAPGLEQYFGFK